MEIHEIYKIYENFSYHLIHTIPATVACITFLAYINTVTSWAILIIRDIFGKIENKNFRGNFVTLGKFDDFDLIIKTLDKANNRFFKSEVTNEKMPHLKKYPCLYIVNAKLSDIEKFRGKKGLINRSGHQLSSKRRNKNKGYLDWDIYCDLEDFNNLDSTEELGVDLNLDPEMKEIIDLVAQALKNSGAKLYWIYLEVEGGVIKIPAPDFSDCK